MNNLKIRQLQKGGTPGRGNYSSSATINGVVTDLHANRHVSKYNKVTMPSVGKDLAIMGAGFVPILGEAIDLYDIGRSLYNKDYKTALIAAGLAFIPGLSYKAYKGIKKIPKQYDSFSTDFDELFKQVSQSNNEDFVKPLSDQEWYEMFGNIELLPPRLNPPGMAPYPERIKPHQTYETPNWNELKKSHHIKLQKPTHQSYGDRAWVDLGEYYNPQWKEFYEQILKPLNPNSKLVDRKPRLINRSNESENFAGTFIHSDDVSLVDMRAINSPTGVHEYISHGTDQFSDKDKWQDVYTIKGKRLRKPFHPNSQTWVEQRATLNSARYRIYLDLKNKLGRIPTLEDFQKYVSNMSETDLIDYAFKTNTGHPINGYVHDYWRYITSTSQEDSKKILNQIKHNLKYVFGVSPMLFINNKENE